MSTLFTVFAEPRTTAAHGAAPGDPLSGVRPNWPHLGILVVLQGFYSIRRSTARHRRAGPMVAFRPTRAIACAETYDSTTPDPDQPRSRRRVRASLDDDLDPRGG